MHPIEQLRYVARAGGADAGLLVQEAASALGVFHNDPAALVTAARRLLTRQPAVGPLWWMCTRLSLGADVRGEARGVIDELRNDRTGRELAHALPDGATVVVAGWPDTIVDALPRRGDVQVLVVDVEGQASSVVRRLERSDMIAEDIDFAHVAGAVEEADLVLIEAAAAGAAAALTDVGNLALAATARALHTPIWIVAAVGRRLPEPYWQAIVERCTDRDRVAWLNPFEVVPFGLVDRLVTVDGVHLPAEAGPPAMAIASELLTELA
ncbi:MAG: hypothetical protein ACFCVK_13310 [Acidimicrobiales bacterium]